MNRRAVLASVSGALLVTVMVPAATSAAPSPQPPGPAQPGAGAPRGDADGDHVSDDLAPRLRAAGAADRLAVIVRGLGPDRSQEAVGRFEVTHRLPIIDGFSAVMTAAQARALARHPGVFRVDADGVVRALDDATNDDYGASAARADRAGLDGSGVGICVADTGVDPAHEQIAPRTVTFKDFIGTRSTAYDDHGHGTHVMAIAAGDGTGGGNAATFEGVAPAATLYAAKVLDAQGSGSDSQVVAGVQWCHAQPGVQVISMSLGDATPSDGTDPLSAAVDTAAAEGDVVVVAAGNSGDAPGTINSPGVAAAAVTVGAASDWSAPAGAARHDDGIWLASFSSRGPVVTNHRVKPDVTGPGVSVTSAQAGTTSGYVTWSGTSMATPYVAGAVALGLEAVPGASPAAVKSALMSSALDRGSSGPDNEWGAGLLDVRAFVDTLAGAAPRRTAFPTMQTSTGTVPSNGSTDVPIVIGSGDLGVPLALTLTQAGGSYSCDLLCQIGFSAGEWSPDLDMELRAPDGTVLAVSECALDGVSCTSGRQETIGVRPTAAGTYLLHVYAWTGGTGAGGGFRLDVSRGPLTDVAPGGGGGEPPPPPANLAPTANAGPDQTVKLNRKGTVTFTLDGSASTDPDGTIVSYAWSGPGLNATSGAQVTATVTDTGPHAYTLTVTDDDGATDADSVTVTVESAKGGGKPRR